MIWPSICRAHAFVHQVVFSILLLRTWDKKTGPNAPLYDMVGGTPGLSVHGCVENWKAGGGRPDQM
jgi:hypothetical protein